jgi:hypothetical protein
MKDRMRIMTRRIDWLNHLIGFMATIIGIFVGLNLEKRQNQSDQNERLQEYERLINEEIKVNIHNLDTFIRANIQYEAMTRFLLEKKLKDDVMNCTQQELDSFKIKNPGAAYLMDFKKLDKHKMKANFIAFSSGTFVNQTTIWESFKNTDLLNVLPINDIKRFTKIYNQFASIQDVGQFTESTNEIKKINESDDVVSEQEQLIKLLNAYIKINDTVDRNLVVLKKEIGESYISRYN